MSFSRDGFSFYTISINNGSFSHTHGQIGGINCPTDSFSIAGSFSDENTVSGTISYATDCQITSRSQSFTGSRM